MWTSSSSKSTWCAVLQRENRCREQTRRARWGRECGLGARASRAARRRASRRGNRQASPRVRPLRQCSGSWASVQEVLSPNRCSELECLARRTRALLPALSSRAPSTELISERTRSPARTATAEWLEAPRNKRRLFLYSYNCVRHLIMLKEIE